MGASPDQLVEDIARHRENLGATLDEIEQRVQQLKPKVVLRRKLREHPQLLVGVLGVAGGLVGWLVGGRRRR